jgi:tripeptide aminopeptidase
MQSVLQRFLRYAVINTQSDESSQSVPSTSGQLELLRLLERECRDLGLHDVQLDRHGLVTATVPASPGVHAPAIAWLAHVDTSPETSGANVRPVVHANYAGQDLVLPADPTKVIRVADNPALLGLLGGTIVTADGTTLLGADDKAGVAVIMAAAERLMSDAGIRHGPVRICFTCDEEIGRGVDHLDPQTLGAVCGYTLDGEGRGMVDCETFSADLAVVTVTGVNIHPSIAKGRMVNAVRILADFLAQLPAEGLSPETTENRQGFIHPYVISGGVAQATARLLLRDFETERLDKYAALLEEIASRLRPKHPGASIEVKIVEQYRNMRDGLGKEPRALAKALEAIRACGLEPNTTVIRGGTDGSRLTALGLPTPNLSTGEHNPHSPLEWTSLEEMQQAVDVLVALAVAWGRETA